MNKQTCPRCRSSEVFVVRYRGTSCVVCRACGYDERDEYEVFPEQRSTQREKASHSPYRRGGKNRTQKREP